MSAALNISAGLAASPPDDMSFRPIFDTPSLPRKFDRGSATVPPLTGSNYSAWKKAIRILFLKVGVLSVVDDAPPPDAGSRWTTCDRWAFSEIFFSCGPGTFHHIILLCIMLSCIAFVETYSVSRQTGTQYKI